MTTLLQESPDVGAAMAVQACDPREDSRWAEALRQQPSAHLAHAPEWIEVFASAYGHMPRYLMAADSRGGIGILPAFLVHRPLAGSRMVSMPFLDGGGPCTASPDVARSLVKHLMSVARAEHADVVEFRAADPLPLDLPAKTHKVNMVLTLPAAPEALWQQISPKVRNQVRKAERSGLSLLQGGSELLDDFYAVFSENMRDLGSPVHSRAFFRHTLAAFGAAARILLVRSDETTVGGLVALAFKDSVYVPWASCLRRYAQLCPNMLLYWGILERSIREGFARFNSGRSTKGSGTYQFKRQWGAQEAPLYWYIVRPDGRESGNGARDRRLAQHATRLWRHLPLRLTRILGPLVRRYLTQ